MRVLYLLLIFQVHAQMQCDKTTIHTTIGREMNVVCSYNDNRFLFSKKYWCLGESRSTCEVLMDTDGFTIAWLRKKARIYETRFRTFHIHMTGLKLEDTGIYWAAIDKIYADIMFRIKVVVTEEAVSRPQVRLDVSPVGTCQGQSVLLHCRTERGTNVKYSWSREAQTQDVLLQSSADLQIHCAFLIEDAQYICSAQNAVSREQSKPISLHLLQAGQENCIYSLTSDELESYDCRTTTASPVISTSTSVEFSSSELFTQTSSGGNQSFCRNQTQNCDENFYHRSWSGMPLWYNIVRWLLFVAIITTFGVLRSCTQTSRVACKHHNHI
ncbi:uncharacterized protein LOC128619396 [Ictalurus furcatus]|uniref:uncharacterized protein LOC128619396 n=1 Tax=Ictalurus furcatus TaxID=66913 RepID=UPI00234FCC52|nr:uncharacterized protein LOC128619396 [Ictalurus furcatus]